MKIRSETTITPLPPALQARLDAYRAGRDFSPRQYLEDKVEVINDYFLTYGLKTAIVAVSGGIDSALTAAILTRVPAVKSVIPVLLPAFSHSGVTNQEEATQRGREVCETLGLSPVIIDVAPLANPIADAVGSALTSSNSDLPTSDWGTGQLIPYTRTPILYYIATMLNDNGHSAVIVGTTNYSEGSYLGYIGKASDAMVDLQPISDIYKSEVYALAQYLGIPASIQNVTPTGDMFEPISDEEVFGASYDFVELYLEHLNGIAAGQDGIVIHGLDPASAEYFKTHAQSLETLHRYNNHKYLAGSPAVHLDVYTFPLNEWKTQQWKKEN